MSATPSSPASSPVTEQEIRQQPTAWRELARSLDQEAPRLDGFLRPLLGERVRVVLTGAGTSAMAGQVLAPGLSRALRSRVDAVATTDLVSNPREHLAEDVPTLLVSFARSGDSPESIAAVDLADEVLTDCRHLVLTCNPDGRLGRDLAERSAADPTRCQVVLMPPRTNDQGFAMTSSVTSMMLAALSLLGGRRDLDRLADVAEEALPGLQDLAEKLVSDGASRYVFLGSGPLTGLARESALKLLELTAGRVVTYADSPLGFRHGPKAVLDDDTTAVVYLSNDPYTRAYDLDIVRELRGALPPGRVIAVGCGDAAEDQDAGWGFAGLGDLPDEEVAPVLLLVAQRIALARSLAGGLDPDNPFPGNEVNRVVQGVTIHDLR